MRLLSSLYSFTRKHTPNAFSTGKNSTKGTSRLLCCFNSVNTVATALNPSDARAPHTSLLIVCTDCTLVRPDLSCETLQTCTWQTRRRFASWCPINSIRKHQSGGCRRQWPEDSRQSSSRAERIETPLTSGLANDVTYDTSDRSPTTGIEGSG